MKNIPPALHIQNLSHAFGRRTPVTVLNNIELRVESGEFCALLGLNGAGKTTLFSLITRLYDSLSGSIHIGGYDVRRQSMHALSNLGVVFQSRTVDSDLTVIQNLTYHGALRGYNGKESTIRAERELDRMELLDRADDKIRDLSGGQSRRVEIARALMHSPSLLLLDEPTLGLDVETRFAMVNHIRGLLKKERIAVLWATHLFDEVQPDDTIYILHKGHMCAHGRLQDVVAQTHERTVEEAFSRIIRMPLAAPVVSQAPAS